MALMLFKGVLRRASTEDGDLAFKGTGVVASKSSRAAVLLTIGVSLLIMND